MCSSSVRRNDVVVVVWWLDWLRADRLTACKKRKENINPPSHHTPTTKGSCYGSSFADRLHSLQGGGRADGWKKESEVGDPREVNMSSPLLQSRANEECLPLHPGQCMDKVRVIDVSSPPLHLAVAGDRSTIVQVSSESSRLSVLS